MRFEKIPGAPFLHTEHNDVSLVTLSHNGIKLRICPNFFLSKSPSNPQTYTFLSFVNKIFTNSSRSGKNCPSLIKITSHATILNLSVILGIF